MKAIAQVGLPTSCKAGLPLPRAAAGEHGFGEDRRRAARRGRRASTCELGHQLRRGRDSPAGAERSARSGQADSPPEKQELPFYGSFAEREGFEPSVGFLLRPLSKRVPSATRSPLQALRGRSAKVAAAWRASRETSPAAALGAQIGLGPGKCPELCGFHGAPGLGGRGSAARSRLRHPFRPGGGMLDSRQGVEGVNPGAGHDVAALGRGPVGDGGFQEGDG